MVKIDIRTVTMDIPPQDVITRDNVPVRVNAVVYYRVLDPNRSIVEVENHVLATSQISHTILRRVLGQKDLDDLLTNREQVNQELQSIIDQQTDPWGVKISVVEVKDVEIPQQMQRAMARQAESERDRRAKIINAEGEYQASQRLRQAAARLESPTALQLRLFQTLTDISSENSSAVILPVPMDLFRPYLGGRMAMVDPTGHRRSSVKRRGRPNVATKRPWDKPVASKRPCGNWTPKGPLVTLRCRPKTPRTCARRRCRRAKSHRGQRVPPNQHLPNPSRLPKAASVWARSLFVGVGA